MLRDLLRNDKMGFQKSQRIRILSQVLALSAFSGGLYYQQFIKKSPSSENENTLTTPTSIDLNQQDK